MNIKKVIEIEPRLAKRHQQLVTEHLNSTDTLSAGGHCLIKARILPVHKRLGGFIKRQC